MKTRVSLKYFVSYCSSRPFYDFIKIAIRQDLAIFNSCHLSFLTAYSPFQKNETMES